MNTRRVCARTKKKSRTSASAPARSGGSQHRSYVGKRTDPTGEEGPSQPRGGALNSRVWRNPLVL